MTPVSKVALPQSALPFWVSMLLIPLAWIGAVVGGWTILLLPLATWYLFSILDVLIGRNSENFDPQTDESELGLYRLVTIVWVPAQFITLFGVLYYITATGDMSGFAQWLMMAAIGILTGTIGINYSHELMHQKPRAERFMGDVLLAMVLYSHFRSEHLLVHHRYVGTPRDPVTARYNEGFYRFFRRVLIDCIVSSFKAEQAMLARKGKAWTSFENPFWRYWLLELAFIALAFAIAGWWGIFLFLTQAFVAVFQLELVNYVEHYGLTRKHLGDGKYEHVLPRHSWNADHRASNWLLINLQRHSDHHYKPDRRFPLLQTYAESDAPLLPYGYPIMTFVALVPPLWRRRMNPRVKAWRARYYPEIVDWTPYKDGTNPLPR